MTFVLATFLGCNEIHDQRQFTEEFAWLKDPEGESVMRVKQGSKQQEQEAGSSHFIYTQETANRKWGRAESPQILHPWDVFLQQDSVS